MGALRLTDIANHTLTFEVLKQVDAGEKIVVELNPDELMELLEKLADVGKDAVEQLEKQRAKASSKQMPVNQKREALRAKLAAAGILGTAHLPPPGMVRPTEEEIREAGTLAPGAKQSHELLKEHRRA